MAYIEMKHSFKRYQVGDTEIVANNDISFEIEKGELGRFACRLLAQRASVCLCAGWG